MNKWLRLPLALVLALLVFVPSGIISGALVSVFAGDGDPDPWLSTVLFQLTMGFVALLIMLIIGRGKLTSFGFCRGSRLPLLRIALAVLLAEGVVFLAFLPLGKPGEGHFAEQFTFWQTVVGVWLIASTVEEIVTRGLVQGFLHPLQSVGLRIARIRLSLPVIAGAVLFAAMHLPLLVMGIDLTLGVQILVATFLLGLIAGYFRETTGSLIPAIIAHMLANVFGMGFDQLSGIFS